MIVAYQNRIVMERTLDQAIARLFGAADRTSGAAASGLTTSGTPATAAGAAASPGTAAALLARSPEWDRLANEARDTYQRALEAQRAGDWAKYGEEIKRLGELLERMRQR